MKRVYWLGSIECRLRKTSKNVEVIFESFSAAFTEHGTAFAPDYDIFFFFYLVLEKVISQLYAHAHAQRKSTKQNEMNCALAAVTVCVKER